MRYDFVYLNVVLTVTEEKGQTFLQWFNPSGGSAPNNHLLPHLSSWMGERNEKNKGECIG